MINDDSVKTGDVFDPETEDASLYKPTDSAEPQNLEHEESTQEDVQCEQQGNTQAKKENEHEGEKQKGTRSNSKGKRKPGRPKILRTGKRDSARLD